MQSGVGSVVTKFMPPDAQNNAVPDSPPAVIVDVDSSGAEIDITANRQNQKGKPQGATDNKLERGTIRTRK